MEDKWEFVRWGSQCPWADGTEATLRTMSAQARCGLCITEMESAPAPVRDHLFFPFNTLLNGEVVTGSPLFSGDLASLRACLEETERFRPETGPLPDGRLDHIADLSQDTIVDSIRVCRGDGDSPAKQRWYRENQHRYRGFVGYKAGRPRAILEFTAALDSPYGRVPRREKALAIACLYSNDEHEDFSQDLLGHLFAHCRRENIDTVIVLSGEVSAYPNGPKERFHQAGFRESSRLGETRLLDRGIDGVCLMSRELP